MTASLRGGVWVLGKIVEREFHIYIHIYSKKQLSRKWSDGRVGYGARLRSP